MCATFLNTWFLEILLFLQTAIDVESTNLSFGFFHSKIGNFSVKAFLLAANSCMSSYPSASQIFDRMVIATASTSLMSNPKRSRV